MRRNLDALSNELYCAVSNWNDSTESETGERILTEAQVGNAADNLYVLVVSDLTELGLI